MSLVISALVLIAGGFVIVRYFLSRISPLCNQLTELLAEIRENQVKQGQLLNNTDVSLDPERRKRRDTQDQDFPDDITRADELDRLFPPPPSA